ncbi:MAG TPA: hypothetical protein VEV84_08325 [Pyrinomonadaceae bacterium]|nr:hypothetical protein [Pyrinomonadaceae bacterium]
MKNKILTSAGFLLAFFLLMATATTFGQGRGGGRPAGVGGGRPTGVGGPPAGTGVDRGLGTASTRSDGRSDTGLGRASTNSNGRSDAGLDRARLAAANANRMNDTELNRYRGLSKRLGTTPEQMRDAYQAALLTNPDLTFGQFVAANVLADNLHTRFPAITSSAILAGLADGDSIGQTLRNLGLSKQQSKDAQSVADDKIKAAKERNKH